MSFAGRAGKGHSLRIMRSRKLNLGNHQDAKHELDNLLKSLASRGLTRAQIKLILFDQMMKLEGQPGENEKQISFKGEGFTKKKTGFFSRK